MSGDLARFVAAQDPVWPDVVAELRAGAKLSHWMWFVFPQIAGLGVSAMSARYALADLAQARAYLAHPLLGRRLHEGVALVLGHADRPAQAIFGAIDAVKFRSSMTLFHAADPDAAGFADALDQFFDGSADPRTLDLLHAQAGPAPQDKVTDR